jgi:hypothetical protein
MWSTAATGGHMEMAPTRFDQAGCSIRSSAPLTLSKTLTFLTLEWLISGQQFEQARLKLLNKP